MPGEARPEVEGVGAAVRTYRPRLGQVGKGHAVVVEAGEASEDKGDQRLVDFVLAGEERVDAGGNAGDALDVDAAEGGVAAAGAARGRVPEAGEGADTAEQDDKKGPAAAAGHGVCIGPASRRQVHRAPFRTP